MNKKFIQKILLVLTLISITLGIIIKFNKVNNASAVTPSKIASTMTIYRSSVSPNWTTKVADHNAALPIPILSNQGQTLQLRQLNVSTRMANSQTGQYYGGSFEITLYFTFSNPMYVNSMLPACENINSVTLQPEQGTVVSNSFSVQACSGDYIMIPQYTQPIGYYFKVKVHGAGKLSASTTVSSYVLAIRSTEEKPFYTINLPSTSGSMGVTLQALDINFSVSNDSSVPGQSDINQNITNIGNKIDDLNQSITDPTVNGDFSQNNVPAFGPVATIVNNIFDLPRVFLNPGQCQAVNLPLPFVNKDLPLTCPSDFMAPYQQIIILADTLASAYILYKTAVYTVRSVKKLRDPENEDEEYLDL